MPDQAMKDMIVYQSFTRKSILTGITRTRMIPARAEDVIAWRRGKLIQDAMPYLSADDREFIMSGITPDEWPSDE